MQHCPSSSIAARRRRCTGRSTSSGGTGILAGRFRRGERVPSTRELAAALRGVARDGHHGLRSADRRGLSRDAATEPAPSCRRELPDRGRCRAPIAGRRCGASSRRSASLARLRGDWPGTTYRGAEAASGVINLSTLGPDFERFPFASVASADDAASPQRDASRVLRPLRPRRRVSPLRREIAAYVARSRAVRLHARSGRSSSTARSRRSTCARGCWSSRRRGRRRGSRLSRARGELFAATALGCGRCRSIGDGHRRAGDLARSARLVYVTPSHQFPTGVSMSLARRLELIEWARGARRRDHRGRLRQRVPLQRARRCRRCRASTQGVPRRLHRYVLEGDVPGPADRLPGGAASAGAAVRAREVTRATGKPRSSSRQRSPRSCTKDSSSATSAGCAGSTNGGGRDNRIADPPFQQARK